MFWPTTLFRHRGRAAAGRSPARGNRNRRVTLAAEILEGRQLLSTAPFVQGTVYQDVNADTVPDAGDVFQAGVTVKVFDATGTTLLAQGLTDANGHYFIQSANLVPGQTYRVTEVPPSGFAAFSPQPFTQIDSNAILSPSTAQITFAPASSTLTYTSLGFGEIGWVSVYGGNDLEYIGQLNVAVTPNAAGGTSTFTSNCMLPQISIGANSPYAVSVMSTDTTNLGPNAGAIAYLYNHYGTQPDTTVHAAAVQLALWELEFDTAVDFSAGNFKLLDVDPNAAALAQTLAAEAQAHPETAVLLDAYTAAGVANGQSMLATRNIDFVNIPGAPPPTGTLSTATIGFWANKNGQALIKSVNGGPLATSLGNWFASNLPNLFGQLAGETNSQVADYFKVVNSSGLGPKLEAQIMAVALASYVTDPNLAGGNYAAQYGFVTGNGGTGNALYNVGADGATLGLTNKTPDAVMVILQAADSLADPVTHTLFANDTAKRSSANNIFAGINQLGDI